MLEIEVADKERKQLLLVKHTHIYKTRQFIKTHLLMLAMEGADKEKTGYFWSNKHTYTTQRTYSKTH